MSMTNSQLEARLWGAAHMIYLHPRFDGYDHTRVLAAECLRSNSPAFVKDGHQERFYVRTGAVTTELMGAQAQELIKQRFRG